MSKIYETREDAIHQAIVLAKLGMENGSLVLWDGHLSPNDDLGRKAAECLASFVETLADRLQKL